MNSDPMKIFLRVDLFPRYFIGDDDIWST